MEWLAQIPAYIDDFFSSLQNLGDKQWDIIAIVVIVFGALFAYLGFRFFKILILFCGFISGAMLGLTIYFYIPVVNTWGELGQLGFAALIGAFGAGLFYFIFFHFGLFVFGAVSAMWLGLTFMPSLGEYAQYRLLVVLALGFLGGFMAFVMKKLILVIATSTIGSVMIMLGLGHFFSWPISVSNVYFQQIFDGSFVDNIWYHEHGVIIYALTVFFLLSGIGVQLSSNKGREFDDRRIVMVERRERRR